MKLVFTSILRQNQGTTDERKEFNPSKMKLRTYRQRFTFTHTDHSLKSGSDLDEIRSKLFVKKAKRGNCVRIKLVHILTDTDHLVTIDRVEYLPQLSNNDQDIVGRVLVVIDDHENSLRQSVSLMILICNHQNESHDYYGSNGEIHID